MITLPRILLVASMLFSTVDFAVAQSGGSGEGFSAFRMVRTRAIFDPERRSIRQESAPTAGPTAPRSNFIALTGTMVTAGRKLAFFSGSRSEYSKVIPEGESVADFKLTSIGPAQVELSLGGKLITVAVGQHVPLTGSSVPATSDVPVTPGTPDAPPAGSLAPASSGPATSANSAAPAAAAPSGAPAPTTDKSELLRRMMERRQKEMSK